MKKILILLLFICSTVYASDEERVKTYVINTFDKGLVSHVGTYITPEGGAEDAQNVRFNKKYGSVSKRDQLLSYGTIGASKVTSLHRYYKSDETNKLIATGSTNIYVGDDDAGTFQTALDGQTDNKRWQWVTYKDIAIGTNGFDDPVKYDGKVTVTADTDGARTANNLMAELGAPFAELQTGTDLSPSSWYQYKIAFYDGTNYYYSNARSNAIQTGATVYDVTLTDIPLGPTGTTTRYIYRTAANTSRVNVYGDTSFYLALTLSNNISTTIVDNVSEATLIGDVAPTWATVSAGINVTPPKGKYSTLHDQRYFISGNTTYKSDIYWSEQFKPDVFLSTSYEQIRPDDGDEITFIKTLLGILTIGKTNSIQKMYTENGISNRTISDPFSNIGSPAPYSVEVTPMGIMFLGRYGLYVFNGSNASLISDYVTDKINDISQAYIKEAFGIYWNNEYNLAYTSESSGESVNNRVLVFDLIRKSFTVDTKDVNCFATLESGLDFGSLYSGSSNADGYVSKIGAAETLIYKRYKSELDLGSFNKTRTFGTETSPTLELSWDVTLNGDITTKGYNLTLDGFLTQNGTRYLIDRPDIQGQWTSPVYQINADALEKLEWNENLNSYGNIEWQLRTGATAAACAAASWSTYFTDPSGSDVSAVTAADFVQLKSNLSTTNIMYTPQLYQSDNFVFKLTYSQEGTNLETAMNSFWESGWIELGAPSYKALLKRVDVFYRGTAGTLTFEYRNSENDYDETFDIDLSKSPPQSGAGEYYGTDSNKVYRYYIGQNSNGDWPIGRQWKFKVYDSGVNEWHVDRIEIIYELEQVEI